MNTEELLKLKDTLNKVTKGPWVSYIEGRDHSSGSSFIQTGEKEYDIEFIRLKEVDQDFIALARNIIPLLVDELFILKAELESIRSAKNY
jgi:hypothetical protein